ncbi:MAG: hypothetical protein AABX55_00305 [Nanoarchaeota archaeon]
MGVKIDIICKNCGMIYTSNDLPEQFICLCKGKDFKVKEIKNVAQAN